MTARSSPPSRTDIELTAFVRGIEHHGLVLAEHQCGHAGRAKAVVAAGKLEFHERAARQDPEAWPALYWQALMAQPPMRARLGRDPRNPFSLLDPGPRAALLLRFVAELDQAQAAQALDVSQEAYRHALFRAVETLRANGIDESWMRALRDRLRTDARPVHADAQGAGADDDAVRAPHGTPHWLRPALVGALCLLAFAGIVSFFWQPAFLKYGVLAGGIETLRDHKPAEVLPATANLIAGGDFGQLSDPQGAAVARDLDLYAWYAAAADAVNAPSNPSAPLPETTLPETSAPDVDADPSEGANAP